jgi:hypothetical protein
MTYIERIHDIITGEIIERLFTQDEIKEAEAEALRIKNLNDVRVTEESQKASAKAALLEKLGITEDEAKLLLS